MKRLNILTISKWYPSEVHSKSGIFVEELAKAVSSWHNVTVLFVYPSPRKIKGSYEVQIEENGSLKVIRARYQNYFPLPGILETALFNWWTKQIFNKVLAPSYKPDIIHAHVYRAGPSALAIGKLANCPVLLSEHSLELLEHKHLTLEFRIFAKHILNKFSRILPVSAALKARMQSLAPDVKYEIVPNVVDTNLFSPATPPLPPQHSRKRMLVVSLLTPGKGIHDLLKALSLTKANRQDFILDIVGDGPESQRLKQLTNIYKLEDNVVFHGMRSKEEVAGFMKNCDFFVLPSRMETFGCVFIEAMACGKPILSTKAGNIPDLVKEEFGVLVPPQNPQALQQAINHMLDNFNRYPSQKIAEYAKSNFSYQAVASQLDRIYKEALAEK